MLKKLNAYYLGISLFIVLLLVLVPPKLNDTYPYLLFLLGALLFNGLFKFINWKLQLFKYINDNKFFNYSDNELLVFLLNTITIASFIYFVYIETFIRSISNDIQSPLNPIKYTYKGVTYFISIAENTVIDFWTKSSIMLFLTTIIITATEKYFRDRNAKLD
jgi:hypothetical protein